MKLLRKSARYQLKRPLNFTPTEKLIRLKAFLISAGNSHLVKGQWDAYLSAYNLVNKINMYLKYDEVQHGRRAANKISKN